MWTDSIECFFNELEWFFNKMAESGDMEFMTGNIHIEYAGTKEDTLHGKRQIFVIEHYIDRKEYEGK